MGRAAGVARRRAGCGTVIRVWFNLLAVRDELLTRRESLLGRRSPNGWTGETGRAGYRVIAARLRATSAAVIPRHLIGTLAAVLLVSVMGCSPREGYGILEGGVPSKAGGAWRTSEGTVYLSPEGPKRHDAQFVIPDANADRSMVRLEALSRQPISIELRCEGPAALRRANLSRLHLLPGRTRKVDVPPRRARTTTIDWRPETGTCHLEWGDGYKITLRPESEVLPELSDVTRAPLRCRADPELRLDPLQRVFLDEGPMLQTCPIAPGRVSLHGDPLDALNARIEALTGSKVSHDLLASGNPDLPLDFSRAPKIDVIQLSYLHVRADFVGYLMARMLAHHAMRGAQVRILVTRLVMTEKDRAFYDSLSARYPNIQIQYYKWRNPGLARPGDLVNRFHRVQHTRAFLVLSPEKGRSRYIFGGRNLHDGFFFSSPFDLTDWPYLHTYDEEGFQDVGFYSVYEDLEVELRDDEAVRSVAAHHMALWNRDAETQHVGPFRPGRTDRVRGMRHYLSLPWADGRDQIRWFADAIDAASEEVLIVTPYLNPPEQIQAALLRARQRGVPVRMVVRLESTDPAGFVITALNRRYAANFAGVFEIEEYFPRPLMMHTKMMVIDRRLAVTTSTNLDHRAFWHDTENGLVFLDTPQVTALLDVVEEYRKSARRLTPDEPKHPLSDALYNWRWLRSVF